MRFALAALLVFGILTLWVPAVWPVSAFEAGSFVLCLVVLWRRPPDRVPYPAIPLALAVIWGLAQLHFRLTAYAFDTRRAVVHWATFLAVFLAGFSLFSDPDVRRWFRAMMVWFAGVVSVWATLQTFTSGGKVLWRFPTGQLSDVMGPIVYHNHWAVFVEVVLPIALFEAFRRRHHTLLHAGLAAVLYASMIASASRAGTVLATMEILVVAALVAVRGVSRGRAIGVAVLRMAVLFAILTAVAGWGRVWQRFWQADPMQVRREFNIASLHLLEAHPFTGSGLGTWATVYPRYAIVDTGTFANQAHDDWLQFSAEGGIIFGLLMFSLLVWSVRPALRSIWGIGILAVFAHVFFDYPFSRPALGSWALLILAMLAARRAPLNLESASTDRMV